MEETELWGELASGEFKKFLNHFTFLFSKPQENRRISLKLTDMTNQNLETRIRITNEMPELVQKIGHWDSTTRQEISLKLAPKADDIIQLYKILRNLLQPTRSDLSIVQTENYLFQIPDYELKLSRQFGRSDTYTFEIEAKTQGKDLLKVCEELGLKPNLDPKGESFWNKFGQRVNLDARDLNDNQLRELIIAYSA